LQLLELLELLLVSQGDNDIRVPKEEAEQVVKMLKDAGKPVEAHYYPNEGHGFSKRENQIDFPTPLTWGFSSPSALLRS